MGTARIWVRRKAGKREALDSGGSGKKLLSFPFYELKSGRRTLRALIAAILSIVEVQRATVGDSNYSSCIKERGKRSIGVNL